MIKFDRSVLISVGLGDLPKRRRKEFLRYMYETLETRVGMRLADRMTNDQLEEFGRLAEADDQIGAYAWLSENFPDHKKLVRKEYKRLLREVREIAPEILRAA